MPAPTSPSSPTTQSSRTRARRIAASPPSACGAPRSPASPTPSTTSNRPAPAGAGHEQGPGLADRPGALAGGLAGQRLRGLVAKERAEDLEALTPASHFAVGSIVLAVSFVLEGASFLQSVRQASTEAQSMQRDLLATLLGQPGPHPRQDA